MKIVTKKIGGIWQGTVEGHPEIDERGLTESVAREKVVRMLAKMGEKGKEDGKGTNGI